MLAFREGQLSANLNFGSRKDSFSPVQFDRLPCIGESS